jgi:serine/threonine protein kinase
MSPEQINGQLSFKSDIWAFGCIILQLCTGLKPFHDLSEGHEVCLTLVVNQENPLQRAIEHNSEKCQTILKNKDLYALLQKCLQHEYQDRPLP